MRTSPFDLTVCLVAVLLQTFPTFASSTPIQLSRRSEYCSNAQETVAGTMLNRRDLFAHDVPSLLPRFAPTVWCIAGTRTYLNLHMTTTLASDIVIPVLSDAYNSVYAHLNTLGDGLVAGGGFQFTVNSMMLQIWNVNNHQVTWGVLGSALWGLRKYMETTGLWGNAWFQIYDGSNLVDTGILILAQSRSGG